MKGETRECAICDKTFYVPPWKIKKGFGLYCSHECFGKSRRDKVNATCIHCHQEYAVKRSKKETTKFCSLECRATWQAENWRGTESPRWGGTEQLCDWCGTRYLVGKWKTENGLSRFCSRQCYGHWRAHELCGKKSHLWRGGRVGYYGPNWYTQRKKARLRDEYTCQRCSTPQGSLSQALDVHHKRPFRDFGYIPGQNDHYKMANRLANLVSLCSPCHHTIERRPGAFNGHQ